MSGFEAAKAAFRADFIRKIQQAQQAQSNWTASESETPAAAAPDPSFGSQLDGCSESVFLYFCDAFGFDVTPYGMQPLHDSLIVKERVPLLSTNAIQAVRSEAVSSVEALARQHSLMEHELDDMELTNLALRKSNQGMEAVLCDQDESIFDNIRIIAEQKSSLAEKDRIIAEKESTIAEMAKLISVQNSIIADKESIICKTEKLAVKLPGDQAEANANQQ